MSTPEEQHVSETVATCLLVFVGCLEGVSYVSDVPSRISISLGAGITVTIILQIFGHISGGFINPTVTISAMIFKLLSLPLGFLYMACQFVGAFLGYALILAVLPDDTIFPPDTPRNITYGFCVTVPNPGLSPLEAFSLEYIANAILVFFCWSLWDSKSQTAMDFVSIKIGAAVFGLVLIFGDYTGPSLNTARSFAPAVFTGVWTLHWIYWLAPISAAIITSFFYKFVFYTYRKPDELIAADGPSVKF